MALDYDTSPLPSRTQAPINPDRSAAQQRSRTSPNSADVDLVLQEDEEFFNAKASAVPEDAIRDQSPPVRETIRRRQSSLDSSPRPGSVDLGDKFKRSSSVWTRRCNISKYFRSRTQEVFAPTTARARHGNTIRGVHLIPSTA